MKKVAISLVATFLLGITFGQRLAQITLTSNGNSDIISFMIDDAVIVNMTKDGKIIDWGVESSTGRYYNNPGRLEKYIGRIEYYTANDNEASQGKVKYIGRTAFTYYSSYENEVFKEKVKSIGIAPFDYYTSYDDEALRGKLKNAGSVSFDYYRSFDNEAFKGKLKTVASSALTYYASYDDKAFKGKIKSIAGHAFTYYSSFDRQEYRGVMKTGYQPEYNINGIKYLLRN